MLVTRQLKEPIDFHTMDVNGYRQLFGYQHSLKYLFLCVTEKQETHTGLKQLEGK